jgi:acyl-CoA thioester hydrolase
MNDFSTKLELRIDWSDLDVLGHVNNLQIMKYVQAARVNYLEKVGVSQTHTEQKIGAILASIHTQFKQPLFYPGNVTIFSRVEYIKTSSFKIHYEIFNDKNELAAEAQDILVLYDFNKKHKLTIPTEIRQKIELIENKSFDF